jgi:protein tyrosine phosphatase (PTP) superfamily phosphohydrolase (DUF442 family)
MKRTLAAWALALALVPSVASAQIAMQSSQNQRQAILDTEYALNVPGLPVTQASAAQSRITQFETAINATSVPALAVPQYGGCDADRGMLSYLQNQLQRGNLDQTSIEIDQRALYDLNVNLRQRGC